MGGRGGGSHRFETDPSSGANLPAALPWLQDDPAEGSEFDADAGILCLKHLLEKAGLHSPRDDQAIADLLAALAPLHKKKMTPDDVTAVLARLPFLDRLRQWMDKAQQEVALQEQLSREQAEHLARAKADLAAAQDQHKTVRLRSFLTLALSEFVTGPDEHFDGQLAEALRDYLLDRKLGYQRMQAQARQNLDRRAEELLARTPLPEDEAEARRKLLLDLRRQCSEAATELKSVQQSCQVSSSRHFLTHALTVALIPRTDSEGRFGAQLVPQLLSWLEILVGRGYYADRMQALADQFGKVVKAAVEGLAQLESQPPPTTGRAPGGGGTSG